LSHPRGARSLADALKTYYRLKKAGWRLRDPHVVDRPVFLHIPKTGGISIRASRQVYTRYGHQPWRWYERCLEPDQLEHSLCVVRDPYARLASAYHYLRGGGINEMDYWWARLHLGRYADINDFVHRGLRRARVRSWIHFLPQAWFLAGHDRPIGPRHVLRHEHIETEWRTVASALGLDPALRERNVSGGGRRAAELDRASLDVVNEVYAADFELLGYPTR
jgi:hypothetical protein